MYSEILHIAHIQMRNAFQIILKIAFNIDPIASKIYCFVRLAVMVTFAPALSSMDLYTPDIAR